MTRPLLLLDAAGVLVFETDSRILSEMAREAGVDPLAAKAWMEEQAYTCFWGGEWSMRDLCAGFTDSLGGKELDPDAWEQAWQASCRPTGALQWLEDWSRLAELWLLSDHRSAWLEASMGESLKLFEKTIISDQQGVTKKDPTYFELIAALARGRRSLYVDDRKENLQAMKAAEPRAGTVLADPAGKWGKAVTRFLAQGA